MNTRRIILLCCIVGAISLPISCKDTFSGEWVAKIDGETITLDELNTLYYAQHQHLLNISKEEIDRYAKDPDLVKRIPTLNKKFFLEELIKQRLIYNKAVKDGLLDQKEVKAVIQIAREGAVVQTYVKEKFKDDIKISNEEIEAFYLQERNKRYRGVPIDQAEKHIKQFLLSRKMQKKLMSLVESLRDESVIEKNEAVLKKVPDTAEDTDETVPEEPVEKE
jgi:hypothetical protein